MQAGRAKVAIVIPHGTTDKLQAGRSAEVQAVIDGVDSITGQQAAAQLVQRSRLFSLKMLPAAGVQPIGSIDIRTLAWHNPSIKALNSMVPGLIGIVLIMPTLALALAFAREKGLGSFEGLASTPIRGHEYIFGKMLPYLGGVRDADEPYDRCYGCGQGNAHGLRLAFEHRDGSAEGVHTAPAHFAGAPGVIHGGAQATMLDEVMGHAIHYGDVDPDLDVVTVEFTLRYRRSGPVGGPLALRGRLVRSEGRDFFVAGEILSAQGEVLTSAESRWRRTTRRASG